MPKSPLSDAQLKANRANAKHSSGPKSPEGRARSSSNSYKHGLTGRKVHLAPEDRDAYDALKEALLVDLRPHTALEQVIADNITDGYWRLSRIRSIEEVMCTLVPPPPPVERDTFDPRFQSALPTQIDPRCIAVESDYPPAPPPDPDLLDAARVWLDKSNAFANVTLYEQRIQRGIKNSMAELRQLQAERKAQLEREMPSAIEHYNERKMLNLPFDPAADGFVCSLADIESFLHREIRDKQVKLAEKCDFNLEKYQKHQVPKAA